MRLPFFLRCDAMHETPWKPKRTGKAKATHHCVVKTRKGHLVGCGASSGSIQEFCLPMAAGISGVRVQGPEFKADSWSPSQTFLRAENPIGEGAAGRSISLRVPNGSLDVETDCRGHPETLWHHRPSQPCMEIIGGNGGAAVRGLSVEPCSVTRKRLDVGSGSGSRI
jgi:hypothetical protein